MNTRKNLSSELADRMIGGTGVPPVLCVPPVVTGEAPVPPTTWETLRSAHGKKYWRTLEELADTPAFQELMRREFPEQADVWPNALSRRQFLTLMGASLALAGLGGCSVRPAPSVNIVPYVRQPEEVVPGKPLFFATAMTLGGAGVGLLVENHMGRPTKIEGNPDHPSSLGAADALHQASVLTLYDPDRSQNVTLLGQPAAWDAALGAVPVRGIASLRSAAAVERSRRGAGLRLLTETVVSPSLHQQIREVLAIFPEARWHQFEPINQDAARRASQAAYGEYVNSIHDFRKADVVVSLDADFFTSMPGSLRYTADFMSRRRVRTTAATAARAAMNRLYVIETGVELYGAKADNRLALKASEIEGFARALAARLGVLPDVAGAPVLRNHERWVNAVAADLLRHRGRSLVIAGAGQPASVHLLAIAMNHFLGNVGQTVQHTRAIEAEPVDQLESLRELVGDMDQGKVRMLMILGGNPVFTAPADFDFAERMHKVPLRIHLGLYQDETARLCHWHLPEAHYLEAWGDTRAHNGVASIVQPLIQPLYAGRSAVEVLSALSGDVPLPGYEIVRNYWRQRIIGGTGVSPVPTGGTPVPPITAARFDEFWQTALHDGVIAGTELTRSPVPLRDDWRNRLQAVGGAHQPEAQARGQTYEIVFRPDPMIYDGRFANNGWLQECPKPITKLTWDNAALMSPVTAEKLGVKEKTYAHGGEHGGYHVPTVELELGGRKVEAPVWIVPGHADDAITVYLGILVMAYYRCPMLCSQVLNGLTKALLDVPLDAGKDFHVVVVSFDAREKPELAKAKKATYLERYGRAGADNGWHFLTGEQESIDRLAAAVGFHAKYDAKNDQFAHASGIMVLTPDGKLARYFYDVSFPPRDLRLGLVEASQGRIGTAADQVLLFCFHYDPSEGKYGPAVMNFVRAGGAATMLAIGGLMFWLWRQERRKKRMVSKVVS